MAITNPIDDPRTPPRRRRGNAGTIEEQVAGAIEQGFTGLADTVLKGFDTVLKSTSAALKEQAEAKRDLQQTLDMVIRAKADALALAGGMGGMAPKGATTPVAVAVQELDEAREIRRRAQSTDENYKRQPRGPGGRFVKREQEVQQQREDRFDDADKRVDEAAAQREQQHAERQDRLDQHDEQREQRVAQAQGRISPASTGRRRRLDYDVTAGPNESGGFTPLRVQTRQGIRESVYRAAAARAEPWADPSGMASDLATRQVERIRPGLSPAQDMSGNFIDEAGNVVAAADAVEGVGSQSQYQRRAMAAQLGMRSLNAWREGAPIGRSLAAALPQGLLKGAGQAAVVVQAANKAWQTVQNQYEENREYQGVYGGGNLNQIDNRIDRWINKNITGRFSMLGGGNYDALYGQGMNLGLQGDTLHGYIDEGAQIMGTGANKQQTGAILGIAVEAGQALNGLSDAIKSVNSAAKDAGINANRAREIFIKNYQASSDIMFGTQGSQRMATAITQAQVGMARQFQDVDMMGSYSDPMRQRMLASRNGMAYTEFIGAAIQDPNAAMIASEAEIKDRLSGLRSELPDVEGGIGDAVDEYMASIGGEANYNAQFDQAALGQYIVSKGFSPDIIALYLKSMGVNVASVNDAPAIAAVYFTGNTPGQIGARSDEEARAAVAPGTTFEDVTQAQEFSGFSPLGIGEPSGIRSMYLQGLNPLSNQGGNDNITPEEGVVGLERNLITEQLISDPVMEAMGVDEFTKILINTRNADGSMGRRIVPLAWALQNAPDQIPTAVIVEGAHDDVLNKTVEQALNLPAGSAAQYGEADIPTLTQEDRENDDNIQSVAEWNEEHAQEEADAAAAGGSEQHVMLELTPWAQQLLQRAASSSAPYQPGNVDTGSGVVDIVVGP